MLAEQLTELETSQHPAQPVNAHRATPKGNNEYLTPQALATLERFRDGSQRHDRLIEAVIENASQAGKHPPRLS